MIIKKQAGLVPNIWVTVLQFRFLSDLLRYIVIEYAHEMRRANAISLLLLYFLVNTELRELVRLPILFEHFSEHKQRNKHVSFSDFIVLHYFSGHVKDADFERDQQLPFRGIHCEELSTPVGLPVESFEEPLPEISYATLKVGIYVSRFHSSLFQFTIWQPPKA
jgi:hypothetical protein